MQLHKQYFKKRVARSLAPALSTAISGLGATDFIRKFIAFLNYVLGQGAGMGWGLDSEISVALACIQSENPVVFDVGANVGEWSSRYRHRQPAGKLFIFEPQPSCQKTIIEKMIANAELIKAAVGRKSEQLTFYSSSATDESASLHERKDSFFEDRSYQGQVVDVISLDEFISERGIAFVDYIKFDIEGHEFEALGGLRESLSKNKIGAFAFEFGSGNLNSKTCFRDFWNLLNSNYSIFIITPSGKLEPITSYYEDLEYYRGVSNFVAKLKKSAERVSPNR